MFDNNNITIGNGGFSLRRTKTFINCFKEKKNLFSFSETQKRIHGFSIIKRLILTVMMQFGFRNNFIYYNSNWKHNEDVFWSIFLKDTLLEFSIPSIPECIEFSFERFPSQLYTINNFRLPFGCHAWEKYEFKNFWEKYISII